jgi:hypothetical protein
MALGEFGVVVVDKWPALPVLGVVLRAQTDGIVISILATHVLSFSYNVGMNTNRGSHNGDNPVGEHSQPAP